jgi:hypothetical protein
MHRRTVTTGNSVVSASAGAGPEQAQSEPLDTERDGRAPHRDLQHLWQSQIGSCGGASGRPPVQRLRLRRVPQPSRR